MAASGGPGAQATTTSDRGDANVIAALSMGWRMAEIYGVVPVPGGPERRIGTHTLAGLDDLSSYRRQLVRLDQIDFALTRLKAAASWPDSSKVPVPDTQAAREALTAIQSGSASGDEARTGYLQAVEAFHLDAMVALEAADPGWGSAYRLGRGLADTTRRMDAGELGDAFRGGRIGNLVAALGDLATLLPAHAGKAVAKSLGWWHTEISRAVHPPPSGAPVPVLVSDDDPPRRRALMRDHDARHRRAQAWRGAKNSVGLVLPSWKEAPSLPAAEVPAPDLHELARALPRQGRLWHEVLTGETAATDRLEPDDYLIAAKGFADQALRLARKAPPTVWLISVVVVAAAVGAVVLIGFASTGSAAGRSAAGLAGFVAALLAGWKAIKARTVGALKQLEKPLWGAELDRAIADAVTLPPVGAGQPDTWVRLAIDGAYQAAAAAATADMGTTSATHKTTPATDKPTPATDKTTPATD